MSWLYRVRLGLGIMVKDTSQGLWLTAIYRAFIHTQSVELTSTTNRAYNLSSVAQNRTMRAKPNNATE